MYGDAALELPHVDDARHVLALDLHRRTRLAHKPRDGLRALQRLGQQELQRDPLVELHVVGGDHYAHPSDPEDALDPVLARDDIALANGSHGHRGRRARPCGGDRLH